MNMTLPDHREDSKAIKTSNDSSRHRCDLCQLDFPYGIALKKHILREHTPGSESLVERSRSASSCYTNPYHDGDGEHNDEEEEGGTVAEPLHICGSCGKAFAALDAYVSHTRLCARIINLKEKIQGCNNNKMS
jgi:hypothetical protein